MNHWLDRYHATEPAPFNTEYRPGLAEAIDKEYTAYSDANPDVDRETLIERHREIVARLTPLFPRHGD